MRFALLRHRVALAWLLPALTACAWLAWQPWQQLRHDQALAQRLPVPETSSSRAPCPAEIAALPSLHLLILGQSNAGNFGEAGGPISEPLPVMQSGGCALSSDPLPGGNGTGGSIWSRLPAALSEQGVQEQMRVAVIAVDASSVSDWSRADSPLNQHLLRRLAELLEQGWQPDLILWQQGEADALTGTSREAYANDFERLRRGLREKGLRAPILLAYSTHCTGADGREVRAALEFLREKHPDLLSGPDTDTLTGPNRSGRCHFSRQGLVQAAKLWATAIKSALPATVRQPVASSALH